MARLILVPEGSGSLAKLQQIHELLQLLSSYNLGRRKSENNKKGSSIVNHIMQYSPKRHTLEKAQPPLMHTV